MKRYKIIAACLFAMFSTTLLAQDRVDITDPAEVLAIWEADRGLVFDAAGIDLEALKWTTRPVVVFADSPNDPSYIEQMELLLDRAGELAVRDVIIIVDTNPTTPSALRLKLRPRGFMMTLIGKDGQINMRKPSPWDVRMLTRSIDKMPMRKREISEGRNVNPLIQQ